MTPAQCKAARSLLGWSYRQLAEHANVAPATITKFETERGPLRSRTIQDIRRTLEEAGVEFAGETGDSATPCAVTFTDGTSVRLRDKRPRPPLRVVE